MPVNQGIDTALDRLFRLSTAKKLSEVGTPEELNPRFIGGFKRINEPAPQEPAVAPEMGVTPTETPPPPPLWKEMLTGVTKGYESYIDWKNKLQDKGIEALSIGAEQTFNVVGEVLTTPFRPQAGTGKTGFVYTPLGEFFPGGKEYKAYVDWKENKKDPSTPVPIPSWKQLGAWLKPLLPKSIAGDWEEPTEYEMARMGMAETAELAPLMGLGAGKTSKTTLEKAADITANQIAKGKTTEQALDMAYKALIKSGELKVPKVAAKPAVAKLTQDAEKRFSKNTLEKVATPKNQADNILRDDVLKTEKAIEDLKGLLKERKPIAQAEKDVLHAQRVQQAQSIEGISREAKTTDEFIRRVQTARKGKMSKAEFEAISKAKFTAEQENLVSRYIIDHPMWYNPQSRHYGEVQTMSNMVIALRDKLLGRGLTKGGVNLQPHEYKMFEQLFGYDFAEALKAHSMSEKVWMNVLDALGIPKAVRATFDFSYALRQTFKLGIANPQQWAKEFGRQFKSFAKQDWYDDLMLKIKSNPYYKQALKDGVDFTETSAKAALVAREESAPTKFINWIPGIKQSARAAASISNGMRFHTYYKYKQMFGETIKNPEEWRQLAMYLNAATGRGNIGDKGLINANNLTYLNRVFFSPRYQVSLMQDPYYTLRYIKNPMVRQLSLRSWFGFIGVNASLVGLGKATGLWDAELDPRATDFGRVRIGDTRIDVLGAYRGWVNLISRLATETTKTSDGLIKPIPKDQMDDRVIQFMRGKVDPVVGAIWSMKTGQSFTGEEFPPRQTKLVEGIAQETLPFAMLDVYDAYVSEGLEGLLMGATGIFGASVSSYPSRTFDTWADWQSETLGKQWTMEQLRSVRSVYNQQQGEWMDFYDQNSSKTRRFWRETHPAQEAQMYFWGDLKSLSTPEAVQYFKEMARQYNTPEDAFPVEQPQKPENISDLSEEELYDKTLDFVPSAFAEYLYNNPGIIKGTPENYQKYQAFRENGLKLTRQYTNNSKGQSDIDNIRYRVQNPEIDAALALWKGYTVKTSAARAILKQMADEIGMPYELIKALAPQTPQIQSSSFSLKRVRS
uniref:Large polyvalent protein associated domain-containing protein n=1 Tax=viral metagenome TaxID=1070528 RepID=A0A6M3K6S0_9ZZZZ